MAKCHNILLILSALNNNTLGSFKYDAHQYVCGYYLLMWSTLVLLWQKILLNRNQIQFCNNLKNWQQALLVENVGQAICKNFTNKRQIKDIRPNVVLKHPKVSQIFDVDDGQTAGKYGKDSHLHILWHFIVFPIFLYFLFLSIEM